MMNIPTPKVYYTVRAEQAFVPDRRMHDPKPGAHIWLDWSGEGGGWPQWDASYEGVALHYRTAEDALEAAEWCPGPWWFHPLKSTFKVFGITYQPGWRSDPREVI